MEVKLSYRDYMAMKPGEKKTFRFDTVKAAYNAKAIAYMMPSQHPRADVKRYSCSIDENEKTLTVEAIVYDEQGTEAAGERNSSRGETV